MNVSAPLPLKKANPERSGNFLLRSDVTRPSAAWLPVHCVGYCCGTRKIEKFWTLISHFSINPTPVNQIIFLPEKMVQKFSWTVFLKKNVKSLFRIPENFLQKNRSAFCHKKTGHAEKKNKKNPGPTRHPIHQCLPLSYRFLPSHSPDNPQKPPSTRRWGGLWKRGGWNP